jgi:hypothetical protein
MNQAASPSRRRATRRATAPLPFFVFIAYGDVAAARDAIDRITRLLGPSGQNHPVQPMLWRFDQLGHARWREMALHDASRAHAVVLAMGTAPTLDGATDAWLTALTDRQDGAPITCLTLMGDEAWTISLQRSEPPAHVTGPLEVIETQRRQPTVAARAA